MTENHLSLNEAVIATQSNTRQIKGFSCHRDLENFKKIAELDQMPIT